MQQYKLKAFQNSQVYSHAPQTIEDYSFNLETPREICFVTFLDFVFPGASSLFLHSHHLS